MKIKLTLKGEYIFKVKPEDYPKDITDYLAFEKANIPENLEEFISYVDFDVDVSEVM